MSVLSDRLRTLREEAGLTQEEFAKNIGIKRATYARYETGDNEPNGELLNKIADFYKVSIDYLYGRSPITPEKLQKKDIEYKKLFEEFERKGLSPERIRQMMDELSEIIEKYKLK